MRKCIFHMLGENSKQECLSINFLIRAKSNYSKQTVSEKEKKINIEEWRN